MAFAVTLWVTEAVPFAVTSLLVVLLIPAFGIADYRAVVRSGFGDPVITFFIGVLILSAAFTRSGLGHTARLPRAAEGRHQDGPRPARLPCRRRPDLDVDHQDGGRGDAAPDRSRDPARRRCQTAAEQLRPRDHDRGRVRPAHRRHRHAGRDGRQPRRHRTAQAARAHGRVVRAMDALRPAGLHPDGAGRLEAAPLDVPA